jgi:2-dehydropantoate 2-reductase
MEVKLIQKVRNAVPDLQKEIKEPYDYIVLATKNIPDIFPTVVDLVTPALPKTNTHTTLVLIQNGLNIEKPFLDSHPHTAVLSGVSMIGSAEIVTGHIVQSDSDRLLIGPFTHPSIPRSTLDFKAREFVHLYNKGGKTDCKYSPDVLHDRWRKLVYNACLNPICAITGLNTGTVRLADGALDGLVRPAMREIVEVARRSGVRLEADVVEHMIETDPLDLYLEPSMLADVKKVRPDLHSLSHTYISRLLRTAAVSQAARRGCANHRCSSNTWSLRICWASR